MIGAVQAQHRRIPPKRQFGQAHDRHADEVQKSMLALTSEIVEFAKRLDRFSFHYSNYHGHEVCLFS